MLARTELRSIFPEIDNALYQAVEATHSASWPVVGPRDKAASPSCSLEAGRVARDGALKPSCEVLRMTT